ncbi:Ent-kaurenoic acid oxidase 1 [Ananas comosus]|uniref:Ent-kaurenoic acid oxidase 1 n=1 Tax=Ananas comosus TaxID=4615 RepID=A0A199UNE6_ANACO|nr:Ent-kaurenoic acid oxidase 1 [Ananas comosus]
MEASALTWWCALLLGAVPFLVQVIWYWNDLRYFTSAKIKSMKKNNNSSGGNDGGRGDDDNSSSKGVAGWAKLPPGHMGLPVIGETLSLLWYFNFVHRPDDFINSKKQRYGEGAGMYRTHLCGKPTIVACTPAANKFVLQSGGEDFRSMWPSVELVGPSSVSNVEGRQHVRIRAFVLAAANHPKSLSKIARAIQPSIVAALRSWAVAGTINASVETKNVIFKNICKMFVSMDPSPVTEEIDRCFEGFAAGFRSVPINFPGTTFHHALQCRRKLSAIFREELAKRKEKKHGVEEAGDLMNGLMQVEDDEGKQMSDDEVIDNTITLVLAGYKSTSLAIMWALYHLSKTPDVLHKLREENILLRKEKKGEFLTLDDTYQLKYTSKVVEETLRLGNITMSVPRVANRDIEYQGYRIPKGWQVLVWIRSLHTDAKNFDDPLSFNPDRWDKPAKPGTFQAFGGGRRICAGNMLARLNLTIILHHLSVGYKWELLNPNAKISHFPHPRPVDGAAMKFSTL